MAMNPDDATLWGPGAIPEPIPGPKGDPGPPPNLSIGSVSEAPTFNVTITGTSPDYTLNFELVKGDKGNKGDPGVSANLSIGTVTTGPTASATITGEPPNQFLNLVLPASDIPNLPPNDGKLYGIQDGEWVEII